MQTMVRFCVTIVILAAMHLAAGAQTKFCAVSGGFGTAIHAVSWGAYEKESFNKYGLDVEYLAIENGITSMQTLSANEVQAVFTTGALGITADLQNADRRSSPTGSTSFRINWWLGL